GRLDPRRVRPVPADPAAGPAGRRPPLRPGALRRRAHCGRLLRAAARRGRPRDRHGRPGWDDRRDPGPGRSGGLDPGIQPMTRARVAWTLCVVDIAVVLIVAVATPRPDLAASALWVLGVASFTG